MQPRLGVLLFDANVLDQLPARHAVADADADADLYVNNNQQLQGTLPPGSFICRRCRW